jgi:hypothetical protein
MTAPSSTPGLILSSDPITSIVALESEKLRVLWQTRQENLPEADRIDVRNIEPKIEDMVKIVKNGLASWDKKRREGFGGMFMSKFHAFCGFMRSHQTLLDVLPQSSEYVSVFYGTITAILSVSSNV